jgi:hypothetical protein
MIAEDPQTIVTLGVSCAGLVLVMNASSPSVVNSPASLNRAPAAMPETLSASSTTASGS